MIISTLALAVMLGATDCNAAKSQNFDPAQKLQSSCNVCHQKKKPLTADNLKGKTPGKMAAHIKSKGKLSDEQAAEMVKHLEAIRDGNAK